MTVALRIHMNMRQAGCHLLQFNELESREYLYSTVKVIVNLSSAVGERGSY